MPRNKVYFYATLAAIGLILMNQVFIQYWLFQKQEDASLINMAGRQRMYSQRILAEAYSLESRSNNDLSTIRSYYAEWYAAHIFLLESQESNFLHWSAEGSFEDLSDLTPFFEFVDEYIKKLEKGDTLQIQTLRNKQDSFLEKMDSIVEGLQIASDRKLNFVIIIEIVFAMMSLSLIYYEITFVFKKIDTELRAKNQDLISSNRMLEEYAYLAAHDLRSPAQNIINFSKVLQKKYEEADDHKASEYLAYILESAIRLKETTNDLLEFSRINTENLELEICHPDQIIRDALMDLREEIESRAAQIEITDLAPKIEGDAGLLRILFQNLISNAIKFVPPERKAEVSIGYEEQNGSHLFYVKDNGIGIRKQDQEIIFKLFKRLHNKDDFKGTGIGLSLCEKIVEKHQGKLYLESQEGLGSKFSIELPKKLI